MSKFLVRVEKIEAPRITGWIEFPDDRIRIRWVVNTTSGQVESMEGEGEAWEMKKAIAAIEIQNELARFSRE